MEKMSKLHKISPFFVLKNKKTGEIFKDVSIFPRYGFLVMNDNDAMTEISDCGDDEDWEWYVDEIDFHNITTNLNELRRRNK